MIPEIFAGLAVAILLGTGAGSGLVDRLRQVLSAGRLETDSPFKGRLWPADIDYRLIIEEMSDGWLLLDEGECVIDLNRAMLKIIDRPREAVLGRSAAEALAPWYTTLQALDDSMQAEMDLVLNNRCYNVRLSRLVDGQGCSGGRLILMRDISSRHRTETVLLKRERDFAALVENAPDVTARFDAHHRHLYANKAIESIWDVPRGQVLGKTPHELGLPNRVANLWVKQVDEVFASGQESRVEFPYQHASGLRFLEARFIPEFGPDGQVVTVLSITRDITERKRSEQALNDLNSALSRVNTALSQANSALRQSEARLQALHSAATTLVSTLDLDTLLQTILDAATRAIPGAQRGLLFLTAERGSLELRASHGYGDPMPAELHHPQDGGELAQRLKTSQACIGEALTLRTPVNAARRGAAIVCPLLLDEQFLGSLALESARSGAFDESDLWLLSSFATTATAAIRNAQLHAEVQKLALTDPLTGVFNRRGFVEAGRKEIARFHRYRLPLSAVMIDIDHFKEINDCYGHSSGDQAIAAAAARIRTILRCTDILGRYGGDELAILLPHTDLASARDLARRLCDSIGRTPLPVKDVSIRITISVGTAEADTGDELNDLLRKADAALYRAKRAGRNCVR